ncbi:MAG: arylsulfotransferase family protein, partial [Actinomycetota bacterium]|nr:arylsulfotransferase family protein [Actinomycetota bacterium]
ATVKAGGGYQADGHEFTLTPQGTALIDIYHAVPYDLSPLGGPTNGQVLDCIVQEIDVATGEVLFTWHSLDHVGLDQSYQSPPAVDAVGNATPYDYFHINSVQLADDGNLLVSARHTSTIYKIDRQTGAIIWRLGGKSSDFKMGKGTRFSWQHNAMAAGRNTVRIFDNASNGTSSAGQSRVLWIHLNEQSKTATLQKSITHPDKLSAGSQGNAEALPQSHTFVGWGQLGRVSEFDEAGKLLFDATLPNGYDTY